MSRQQHRVPIVEQLGQVITEAKAPFYAPGHKRGVGINPILASLLGGKVFAADVPELPELDNLFNPEGVIAEAESLAADAFGAEQSWFLVNGSTCGVMAAILATCGEGDKLILPRNAHQSAIAGLICAGAIPIFLNPVYNSALDILESITPESLEQALVTHPDAKAVLVVYPTYQGICADLGTLATLTHSYGIPLLVDEAHGPHFHFHPQLPASALSLGADVTVQSIHKVLGAMTQASMLHLQGNLISPARLNQALQLLQSSSPSYILLASLDAARQQMALQGKQLLSQTLALAQLAREEISQIPGLKVLQSQDLAPGFSLDSTRLTVLVQSLGLTGFEADEILNTQLGVTAELPLPTAITFIISIGNTLKDIEALRIALRKLAQNYRKTPLKLPPVSLPWDYQPLLSPRQAYFAPTETKPLAASVGYGSGELICPYPPGIPVLMPGEKITQSAIAYLQQVKAAGAKITGGSDPSLATLKVIKP